MIKVMMFVSRLPELSFEAFRDHYEQTHVPLARSKFTYLRRYVRNYLPAVEGQPEPFCDCVTELWFENMTALQAQAAAIRGDVEIEADERLFMDKMRTRSFVVDERDGHAA